MPASSIARSQKPKEHDQKEPKESVIKERDQKDPKKSVIKKRDQKDTLKRV